MGALGWQRPTSKSLDASYPRDARGRRNSYGGSESSYDTSYGNTSALNDVTTGQTASCGSILCTAATGWDGPTGLGTPNGTDAF